jgi:hypothetical protein
MNAVSATPISYDSLFGRCDVDEGGLMRSPRLEVRSDLTFLCDENGTR